MQLSDIDNWNVPALHSISYELSGELRTVDQVAADLDTIGRLPGWHSPAADAARGRIESAKAGVLNDAAVIGAVEQLATETAQAVTKLQAELEEIRSVVTSHSPYMQMSDSGEVTVSGRKDKIDELKPIADQLEVRAKALIKQAEDIDADCAEVFGHLTAGDITAAGATTPEAAREAGHDQSGLSAPYPPEGDGATPNDVKAWWDALPAEEQQKVMAEHPDWIGNRDGVPVVARSEVNKADLDRQIAAVQSDMSSQPSLEQYKKDHSYLEDSDAELAYGLMMAGKQSRLDELTSIKKALSQGGDPTNGYDPDKYLMMLRDNPHGEAMAAIAVGNPDTAEHVSVTTPGMNTHPDSLPGMVNEVSALRQEALNQLSAGGTPVDPSSVSTIAWLGYDPPDVDNASLLGVGSDARAQSGAVDLANFYRGVNATNEHGSDVQLSAFGHSYGSLTTAQALHDLGQTGVVDDAVFYGSPGLGTTGETTTITGERGGQIEYRVPIRDESDLFLPNGHGYVMQAPDDPITWLGAYGTAPQSLPLEHLGTGPSVTDPGTSLEQTREGASAHSDYPRMGNNGVLRTTGYNLAVVLAGLGQQEGRLVR